MSGFEATETRPPASFVPDQGPTTSVFAAPPEPVPDEAVAETAPEELEAAFQAGYAAGEAAARDSLPLAEAQELETAALVLRQAVDAFEERGRGQLVAEPRALVELALSISEHLLRQQLGRDPDALVARVSQAIQSMPEREPVRIEISTHDHQTLSEAEAALATLASETIEIEAHAGLAPGEFRLTAGAAETDGRLRSLLASVRESLAEECAAEEDAR